MKIIFTVSEDWYFVSHRLPLAEEALRRGWEVLLLARVSGHENDLRRKGVRVIHVDLDRGGLNPLRDFKYCLELRRLYRKEKPDLVHHVAMKPCLYGSIAARWARVGCCVNAVAGFGTLFSSRSRVIGAVRPFVLNAFRHLFSYTNSRLIVQNTDDVYEFEHKLKLQADQIRLIRGSGVDLETFCPADRSTANNVPLIVMVSRLLADKGVLELIEAGKLLRQRGVACRIALVGDADPENVHAVSDEVLHAAESTGAVELWGRRSDVADIYKQADIAVLPSYREGLPKSLIEAAACGLPIVTTDVPGCREIVNEGVNGFLVPVKQSEPLADALGKLVQDADLRRKMGERSREKAIAEFDVTLVVQETFAIYEELLRGSAPQCAREAK